jgi:hypothetical protein
MATYTKRTTADAEEAMNEQTKKDSERNENRQSAGSRGILKVRGSGVLGFRA